MIQNVICYTLKSIKKSTDVTFKTRFTLRKNLNQQKEKIKFFNLSQEVSLGNGVRDLD